MITKIILWVSVIWLVPVMYFLLKNEAKFKKNIAVGVTFPFAGRQDPDVLAALARFKKRLLISCVALLVAAVPCFFAQGFGLMMGLWCGWLDLCIVVPYIPYVLCNRELKKIKAEKGYAITVGNTIFIDTAAIPHGRWLSPWVFIGALALTLVPLLWERSFAVVYLAFALSVVLSFFCYRYFYRNKSETVDENVELSRVLTQVRRHNWGQVWVLTAYSFGIMSLCFSCFRGHPTLSLVLLLIICFLLTLALMGVELRTRRVQEKLTRDSGLAAYVDEDDRWLGGLVYYNPNDSRTIINNRVGINTTVNLAKPGGKVLVGAVVLLLVALPFSGALLSGSDTKPITLTADGVSVTAAQGRSEYSVALEEITSLELVEELPEGLVRTMGTGMEHLLKGNFSSNEMDRMKLCLDPTVPPFLLIGTEEGTCYLFGTRDGELTRQVFEQLSQDSPK